MDVIYNAFKVLLLLADLAMIIVLMGAIVAIIIFIAKGWI